MRLLIAVLACLILGGCATQTQPLKAKPVTGGTYAVATLSSWGTFEMETGPIYTRIAVLVRSADVLANNGKLSAADVEAVIAHSREAKATLSVARQLDEEKKPEQARAALARATESCDRIEKILQGARK